MALIVAGLSRDAVIRSLLVELDITTDEAAFAFDAASERVEARTPKLDQ